MRIHNDAKAYKTFVLVLTARGEPLDKIYGNIVDADYYLTKPFRFARLMDIVKELTVLRYKDFRVGSGDHYGENY